MATTRIWKLQLAAAATSLALVSMLVMHVSSAAFSATTSNGSNSWATGSITLSDDDGGGAGSAMFNVTGMLPGDTVKKCIVVTYTGAVDPTAVKLYTTVTDSGLGDHLDVTVKEGTGGTNSDCTGFTATSTIVSNSTLTAFGTAHSGYANGAGVWNPTTTGDKQTYEFTVTLGSDTPSSAQGGSSQATFTWETTT